MSEPPFKRTKCSCAADRANCSRQPGHLVPGDLERIAPLLPAGTVLADWFWASPGAVVMDTRTREVRRVGTITPRMEGGCCVFLAADGGDCRIHAVAPFGCAYFDVHMDAEEGHRRASWGVARIAGDEAYQQARAGLPAATSWRPNGY